MNNSRFFSTTSRLRIKHSCAIAVLEEAYRSFVPLFPQIPTSKETACVKFLQTPITKAASADPKAFYDNSFLNELEKSGFVKELYGQR